MLKLVADFAPAYRLLANIEKQAKFATAKALTQTAAEIRREVPAQLDKDLDRPTPFTKRGLYLKAARRDSLVAEVGFMDRQAKYMRLQVAGGTRTPGPRGIMLPGNIKLNTFGNVPKGAIEQLKQAAQSGQLSGVIAKRLGASKRRKGSAPLELFFGKPAGKGWEDAPVGIWRRVPGKLIPVVVFSQERTRYRPRFDFGRLAQRVVDRNFARFFEQAFREAMASAR